MGFRNNHSLKYSIAGIFDNTKQRAKPLEYQTKLNEKVTFHFKLHCDTCGYLSDFDYTGNCNDIGGELSTSFGCMNCEVQREVLIRFTNE